METPGQATATAQEFSSKLWAAAEAEGECAALRPQDWVLSRGPDLKDLRWGLIGGAAFARRLRRGAVMVLLLAIAGVLVFPTATATYLALLINWILRGFGFDLQLADRYVNDEGTVVIGEAANPFDRRELLPS
jgi:hypothetical protein